MGLQPFGNLFVAADEEDSGDFTQRRDPGCYRGEFDSVGFMFGGMRLRVIRVDVRVLHRETES